MKIAVISPKCTSKSAQYIAENLDAYYENPYKTGRFNFEEFDLVVNWGYSSEFYALRTLNPAQFVRKAVSKKATFTLLAAHTRVVPYTMTLNCAISWVNDGNIVVGRLLDESNRSKGIDFLETEAQILEKPYKLFTKYINHIGEFRINVYKGKVITILEKEVGKDGNFKFKLVAGEPTKQVKQMIKAVDTQLELDYYGLDVLVDSDYNVHLLEVNSAPALFGTTGIKFINLLKKEI